MSKNELTCEHGIAHSNEVHGCDGCCASAFPISEDALSWLKNKEKQTMKMASLDTLLEMRDQLKGMVDNDILLKMSSKDIIELMIDSIERKVWEDEDDA